VVLNPGDILVVNTNWWFHETKVLQVKKVQAIIKMLRCYLES